MHNLNRIYEYQTLHILHMYFTFVTLSSYKRAKTAETSANLPLGEIIQGRFAKHLRDFFRMTNRK